MSVKTRVRNGAFAFDALKPDWATRVCLEHLCLDSLLVQVFGTTHEGIRLLMNAHDGRFTQVLYLRRGFGLLPAAKIQPHKADETVSLLVQWRKQIEMRLS